LIDLIKNEIHKINQIFKRIENNQQTEGVDQILSQDFGQTEMNFEDMKNEISFLSIAINENYEVPKLLQLSLHKNLESVFHEMNSLEFADESDKLEDVNLEQSFERVVTAMKELADEHYSWVLSYRYSDIGTSNAAGEAFKEELRFIQKRKGQITKILSDAKTQSAEFVAQKTLIDASVALLTEIEESVTKIEEDAREKDGEISAFKSTSDKNKTSLDDVLASANELADEITTFKSSFASLNGETTQLKTDLTNRMDELDSLYNKNAKRGEEIDTQILDAEEMLKGATTAGLARAFSERRDKLNTNVHFANFTFYVAIGLFLLFSLPLVISVVPILGLAIEQFFEIPKGTLSLRQDFAGDPFGLFANMGAKFLLVIPFGLLLSYTSKRHNRLFKLREHYSYKASLAQSVDGFKKQSPGYEAEIAAATFQALTFNPAESMDSRGKGDDVENSIFEFINKKIQGYFENKGNE
jgi:hypothetical protein